MSPSIQPFFHAPTSTFSYVVWDAETRTAAVIDPVLDYEPSSGRTSTRSAAEIVAFVREQELSLRWILETHAHADHLTAAQHVRAELGGMIAIGEGITQVQGTFKQIFNLHELETDGRQFDRLFYDEETFWIGRLGVRVLATPGHTSDSVSYLVGDAVFVGDTLFAPDYGTARADFPGGDARTLYRSIRRLLDLPGRTRMLLCHDYTPAGREPEHEHSVLEQRNANVHVRAGIGEDEFVRMRDARDASLPLPRLMIPAVQVNIRAGRLPPPEDNGISYLKVPLNLLGRERPEGPE